MQTAKHKLFVWIVNKAVSCKDLSILYQPCFQCLVLTRAGVCVWISSRVCNVKKQSQRSPITPDCQYEIKVLKWSTMKRWEKVTFKVDVWRLGWKGDQNREWRDSGSLRLQVWRLKVGLRCRQKVCHRHVLIAYIVLLYSRKPATDLWGRERGLHAESDYQIIGEGKGLPR
jgi:hypothetical protein